MLQIPVLHSVSETAKTDPRNSEAQALERCLRTVNRNEHENPRPASTYTPKRE